MPPAPHSNPHGERIRAGGMTLVHCHPTCSAEFRSASDASVIHAQLEAARWQVTERSENSKKAYTYRCPAHPALAYSPMTGKPLPPMAKRDAKAGRGRASHDGGKS